MTRYRRGLNGDPACRIDEQCPNYGVPGKITCREANRVDVRDRKRAKTGYRPPAAPRANEAQHGTISLYRSKSSPCQVREECPNYGVPGKITCSDAQNKAAVERTARLAAQRPPRQVKHGENSRWRRGCRVHTECPHYEHGLITCYQAHIAWLEDERKKRAAENGFTGMLNRAAAARATTT